MIATTVPNYLNTPEQRVLNIVFGLDALDYDFITNSVGEYVDEAYEEPNHPRHLTKKEEAYIGEGFEISYQGHKLWMETGAVVWMEKQKWLAIGTTFHFRNDATRHLWGSPVRYETDLPDRETMLDMAVRFALSVRRLPPLETKTDILVDGYPGGQADGSDATKDRHVVVILIPFAQALRRAPASFSLWTAFLKKTLQAASKC